MTELAKEYGAALFALALEKENKLGFYEALQAVESAFSENPMYIELLASPSISQSERTSALEEAFSTALPEEVLSYLKLLVEKGRISLFSESVLEYKNLLDASMHTFKAVITSAVELTEEEKSALIRKLEKSENATVLAEFQIDPALIGGVVVEMNGKILDGSIRHRLHLVKEVLNP